MGFNLVTNLGNCSVAIGEMLGNNYSLLNYSHIPTAIIALFLGFFILFKNKNSLAGKVLFALSLSFSLWLIFDYILWTSNDSRGIMFFWSLLGILDALFFILSLYFVYVFIDKKDISFLHKMILGALIFPIFLMTPTSYNLINFSVVDCEAVEGGIFLNYIFFIELLILFWIVSISVLRYIKADKELRKQILLLSLGIVFFLLTFFFAGFIADALVGVVYGSFKFEFYGLFGMTIFLAFLSYLIVQYNAFKIKLIGAQALVVSLIILIGSQFAFIQNNINRILTGITLALSLGFGFMLIRSVKKEVKQREELEIANKEINDRKEQLQEMADRLATANDSLRKLDNAKTEFISIASHQLRTPITAIKGFASLLLEGSYGDVSEGVHGALDKIYVSTERLVQLIEDLLNVSRIESGRMTFAFEKANVEKLLKELQDNFVLIAKDKKFYLDLKLPETHLPEIVMDYSKVRELVSNFIDNALKYTERGGVTIKAEIREDGAVIDENGFVVPNEKSKFGKMLRITVSDTGIGIPKEEIPYLFKKFSRGKDVSRLHVGGTGLGLFVGKAIAEAHHGAVWVESDGAGKGSRFIIEVPMEFTA